MSMSIPAYRQIKRLPGWLAWTDYTMLAELVGYQNEFTNAAIVEIGVHFGKSLIALAGFSGERALYAIDIFDDQSHNIDQSGYGSLNGFRTNLRRFGVREDRVVIDQRLSTEVKPRDILDRVGKVGLFHIDGGHHYDAVVADIDLAVATCSDDAIIVMDDVFRPEWPEVSEAVFRHPALRDHDYVAFAIGFNKTYFCKRAHLARYQHRLRSHAALDRHLSKTHRIDDRTLLVYQKYPLPEWPLWRFANWALKLWVPGLYGVIAPVSQALKPTLKRLSAWTPFRM
ncbi:MAG: class I SAM-dependent methyltransferase [Burkholderiaceae bacterium]